MSTVPQTVPFFSWLAEFKYTCTEINPAVLSCAKQHQIKVKGARTVCVTLQGSVQLPQMGTC